MSLRDKQIREALDEDLKAYNEVLKREFKQARLMNESYAPPNRLERKVAFEIEKYFIDITSVLDRMVSDYTNSMPLNGSDINQLVSLYQTLIAFLDNYASTHPLNQRDLATLEDKFDALLPNLEEIAQIADVQGLREAKALNALYGLLSNRNYISLRGNVEDVQGRDRMLVHRRDPYTNPHFDPDEAEPAPQKDRRLRPQWAVFQDTDLYNREVVEEGHTGNIQHRQEEEEQPEYNPLQEYLRNRYGAEEARASQRKQWDIRVDTPEGSPERPRGRERLTKDQYKAYIGTIGEAKLREAVDSIPHIKEAIEKSRSKNSLSAKIKNNEAYMRDIYSLLEEGVKPMEYLATPRGRKPRERDESVLPFPVFEQESEMEGDGRTSFVKTQRGRFQIRGKGESEDKMFGLPYGFKKALDLRPIDKRPIVHHNGQNFDLTLEDRMEFLNQLDSHKVSDEEFKLNSIRNLAEMKEAKKHKKKPIY